MLIRSTEQSPMHWMVEDAYIQEIGKIRSELGEIEQIYADYEALLKKVQAVRQSSGKEEHVDSALRYVANGVKLLRTVDEDLRKLTQTSKESKRSPIDQLELTGDLKRDVVRLSENFARLAVRIRNVGQELQKVGKIDLESIKARLEKAYLTTRRAFVMFDKVTESKDGVPT